MKAFNIEFTAVTAAGKQVRDKFSIGAVDKYAAQDFVLQNMIDRHGDLYRPVFKFGAKKFAMSKLTEHVLVTTERCDD